MAIYHASFKIISRSNGSSSVASAAYRSGERLVNHTTGEIHHYAQKDQSVSGTLILAPANAPDWVHERSQLWSAVEKFERRKDAQLARELNVALPFELSQAQQTELIRDYVQAEFVDHGMVADIALHDLDTHNPHAHVMLTMRDIDSQGFGKKNRSWNNRELLQRWREHWSVHANDALERAGVEARIDHRSLEDQGVERLPTIHLGHEAHALEKRGIATERGDYNRAIERINAEIKRLAQQIVEVGRNIISTRMKSLGSALASAVHSEPESQLATAQAQGPPIDTSRGRSFMDKLKAERDAKAEQEKSQDKETNKRSTRDISNDYGMGR